MLNRWIFYLIIFLAMGVAVSQLGLSPKEDAQELIIFAAASVNDVFLELVEHFTAENPDVKISLSLASSGTLQIQIQQGAIADLFASAGNEQMDALLEKGLIQRDSVQIFAENRLVIAGSKDRVYPLTEPTDLLRPEVSQLGIADPASAPAGHYAARALINLGLWDKLSDKLIYAGNVRQVLQHLELG